MEILPRQELEKDYASDMACAICGEEALKVNHVKTLPDYVSCRNCGSAFVAETGGDRVMYGKIAEEYESTRRFALGEWAWPEAIARRALEERPPPMEAPPEDTSLAPTAPFTVLPEPFTETYDMESPPADAEEDPEPEKPSTEPETEAEPEERFDRFGDEEGPAEFELPEWEAAPAYELEEPPTVEEEPPQPEGDLPGEADSGDDDLDLEDLFTEPDFFASESDLEEFFAESTSESEIEAPVEDAEDLLGSLSIEDTVLGREDALLEADAVRQPEDAPAEIPVEEAAAEPQEGMEAPSEPPLDAISEIEAEMLETTPEIEPEGEAEPALEPESEQDESEALERVVKGGAVGVGPNEPPHGERHQVILQGNVFQIPRDICAHCTQSNVRGRLAIPGSVPDERAPGQRKMTTLELPLCEDCHRRASARSAEYRSARIQAHLLSGLFALILVAGALALRLVTFREALLLDLLIIVILAVLGYTLPLLLLMGRAGRVPPPQDALYVRTTLVIPVTRGDLDTTFEWRNRLYAERFLRENADHSVGGVMRITDRTQAAVSPPSTSSDAESEPG